MLGCSLEHNIERRGRIMRFFLGIILLALAYASFKYAMPQGKYLAMAAQGLLAFFGVLSLFESAVGWCAVKAWRSKRTPPVATAQ